MSKRVDNRMSNRHVQLSARTQKHIWGLFAARCAICREHLVHDAAGSRSLLGHIAHIVGDKSGAARGDDAMPSEERSSPDNLILLCQAHHKIIDDNPAHYTVQVLREIRQSFLQWLSLQLAQKSPWSTTISQYLYINVPRLDEFSLMSGFSIQRPPETDMESLHRAGRGMNHFMQAYREAFESTSVTSIHLDEVNFAHEGYVGQVVAFDSRTFLSEGLPRDRDDYFGSPEPSARPRRPTLSTKVGDVTLSVAIDSRWITTTTGYLLFTPRSGVAVFSGVVRITSVDHSRQTMTATALILGVPSGGGAQRLSQIDGLGEVRSAADARSSNDDARNVDDDEDEEDGLLRCTLCKRVMTNEQYMVYGQISDEELGWATLCSPCVSGRKGKFVIRHGKMFKREGADFKFVADLPEG